MSRLNLADDLRANADRSPESVALIYQSDSIPYAELNGSADRVAAGLVKLGVRKGDRVAFSVGNTPHFPAIYYGVLRAGAVAVPLNTSLTAAELRPYLSAVAPRAIIASEATVNEVMSAGPHSAPVFVIGKHLTARPYESLLLDSPPPDVPTGPDDLAVLAYTSGTSGSPKGAMLTHGNLDANIKQMIDIPNNPTRSDDVVLGVLPMFHIYAMNVILGLSVRQGAAVVLQERFDVVGTMELIERHGVSIIVGAPPMFAAWLKLPESRRFDLSKVRFAVSGASALDPQIIGAFRQRFGVEIWEGYGLTETSPTVATTRMADQRPGSIGKPIPGVDVRIVSQDAEEALPGDPGEIWVRGANVFKGYWGDEEASGRVLAEEWLKTGDIAYRDEDGYLWLVDRLKELIIVSGFNVYPKEVEDVLREHPAVLDAAVMGAPHPQQGECVKAYVALTTGQTASSEELVVHCTKNLARFKVPSEIEIVDELPRLATGKVLKRRLRPRELGPA